MPAVSLVWHLFLKRSQIFGLIISAHLNAFEFHWWEIVFGQLTVRHTLRGDEEEEYAAEYDRPRALRGVVSQASSSSSPPLHRVLIPSPNIMD